jgi:phosphoenolpyruvate synthase/pyruvate phosphate dikinase
LGDFVVFLDDTGLDDLRQVGGKAANLGHLTGPGSASRRGFP